MYIDSNPIKNDALPVAESTFVSKGIRGIGAVIQRVYNAPLWRDPTCVTSLACGALGSIVASAGAYFISSAVDDINDLLAPCETLSPESYREALGVGLKYGLSCGIITVVGIAALIKRGVYCSDGKVDFSNGGVDLSDGEVDLSDGEVDLSDGEIDLSDGQVDLSDGEADLSDGEVDL